MSDPFGYDECSPESPCEACRTRHPNGWPTLPDPRIAELEAEVARLEALIVATVDEATGIDADLYAEADRIRSRKP